MILVTGGTGLVGAQLILDLLLKGEEVRALRRENSNDEIINRVFLNHKNQLSRIEWIKGDITDIFSIEEAMQNSDRVFHAAGLISFHKKDAARLQKINVEGTANMVNTALNKGISHFCHISSVAALGRSELMPTIDETNQWKASKLNSNYAISKYGAEREVWRGMEEGLNAVIVNPSIIFGPGNWSSGSSSIISKIDKGMPFYTNGTTGFVDVRDVSACAIELMQHKITRQRFILNSESKSYREVFNMVADALGKKRPQFEAKPWLTKIALIAENISSMITGKTSIITPETVRNSSRKWYYSNEKIKKAIDWEFISVSDSVEAMVSAYQQSVSQLSVK